MAKPNREYEIGASREPSNSTRGFWRPWIRMMGKIGVENGWEPSPSQAEAFSAAARMMVEALNARTRDKRKHRYGKMSGQELSIFLAEMQITATEFAILYGSHLDRVIAWLDGAEDIPHPVRLLTALLSNPANLVIARRVTEEAIAEGKEAAIVRT